MFKESIIPSYCKVEIGGTPVRICLLLWDLLRADGEGGIIVEGGQIEGGNHYQKFVTASICCLSVKYDIQCNCVLYFQDYFLFTLYSVWIE